MNEVAFDLFIKNLKVKSIITKIQISSIKQNTIPLLKAQTSKLFYPQNPQGLWCESQKSKGITNSLWSSKVFKWLYSWQPQTPVTKILTSAY